MEAEETIADLKKRLNYRTVSISCCTCAFFEKDRETHFGKDDFCVRNPDFVFTTDGGAFCDMHSLARIGKEVV